MGSFRETMTCSARLRCAAAGRGRLPAQHHEIARSVLLWPGSRRVVVVQRAGRNRWTLAAVAPIFIASSSALFTRVPLSEGAAFSARPECVFVRGAVPCELSGVDQVLSKEK
jgi:hypothetical protein